MRVGGFLADAMGPRYYVQREVQIPDGSMFIPDDAREMAMLLDRTTGWQKGAVALGTSMALIGAAQILSWVSTLH